MPLTRRRRTESKVNDYVKPIFRRPKENSRAVKNERNVVKEEQVGATAAAQEQTEEKARFQKKRCAQTSEPRKRPRGERKKEMIHKNQEERRILPKQRKTAESGSSEPENLLSVRGTEKIYNCSVGEVRRGSIVLAVLSVRHYIQDRAYWFAVDGSQIDLSSMDADAYDITLCHNGERLKTRVCLHPRLNLLVQRGDIRRGSIIEITMWSRRLNEVRGMYAHQIIIVHECEVLHRPEDCARVEIPSTIEWTPSAGALEVAANVPLASSRKTYLGPDAFDALPVDSRWRNPSNLEYVTDPKSLRSLLDASMSISDVFANNLRRPFAGRILQKTAIAPWPKRSDTRQSMPLKFEFVIGNGRDVAHIVVWNSLCMKYYYHLQLGDIVYVDNYRIRRGEIHLNAASPQGTIRRLPRSSITLLPFGTIPQIGGGDPGDLYNQCILTTALDSWEDGEFFSLTGIVTYVSPLFRERGAYRSMDRENAFPGATVFPEDYFVFKKYRIILLRDGSEARDVCIRLYETSQRDQFDASCEPGAAVLLTALEKHEKYNSPLDGINISEICSTRWTAIYRLDNGSAAGKDQGEIGFRDGLPFVVRENPLARRIIQVLRWLQPSPGTKSTKLKQIFSLDQVQHSTFRYVDTLEQFAALYASPEQIENMRVEFERLKTVRANLFLRESQQVLVYGYLTCMKSLSKSDQECIEAASSAGLGGKVLSCVADEALCLGKLTALNQRSNSIYVIIPPGRPVFGSGIAKVYNKRTAFLGRFGGSLRGLIRGNGLSLLHDRPMACLLNLYRVDSSTDFALLEVAYEIALDVRATSADFLE
ncbi:chromosome X 57 [Cyanidiococcus yangmingshanensis]|uniref:Chromosome X 57 n=1 Tax=Cyanidiococcus yangmingshanensis TaxID=2690220 RepID=A0A7J7IR12_9RHOD|nr:chromosome X 57 [Cyanidiococcus yangmingshanensis]